jgi:hypothetical protein
VPHPKEQAIRDRAYAIWERATNFWSKFLKADHRTAKEVLTSAHVPKAPFNLSDAIENELYRLEAGRGVRRIATRTARFIVRPESMTAYATLAAAFAACLSVKAAFLAVESADRQEKAAFTNTLLGKQVDVLATASATVEQYRAATTIYTIYDVFNKTGLNAHEYRRMLDIMEKDVHAIMILYPEDAQSFLSELQKHIVGMKTVISRISGSDTKEGTKEFMHESKEFMHESYSLARFFQALETCSAAQLRRGKYIDGPTFQSCTGEWLKAQKARDTKRSE